MNPNQSSNVLLKEQRLRRGWTLEEAAERLYFLCPDGGEVNGKMFSRWETGRHKPRLSYQQKLCELYNCGIEDLGFVEKRVVKEQDITTFASQHIGDSMDLKRRQFLQLAGAAGTTLLLPFDIDIYQARAATLDGSVLQSLETVNVSYWQVYHAAANKQATLDAVLGHLKALTQFLKDARSETQRQKLCVLVSDMSQLAGEIFFDADDYDTARSCYNLAATTAKDAQHFDLWSCALVRQSFLDIYNKQYRDALPLLQGAQKIALKGDSSLVTRYWASAVLADAQAGVHNLVECQKALDIAEQVQGSANGGWLRYDGTRINEQRGSCMVKLGEPGLAIPSLEQALRDLPDSRRRWLAAIDRAKVSLLQKDVASACGYAESVIEHGTHSGVVKKALLEFRGQLGPFAKTTAVKSFDKQLAVLQ